MYKYKKNMNIKKFEQYLNEKMAHKYNLIVKWSNRPAWNIKILAIDAENVTSWIPSYGSSAGESEDDYITSIEIILLERNVEIAKGYTAKGID